MRVKSTATPTPRAASPPGENSECRRAACSALQDEAYGAVGFALHLAAQEVEIHELRQRRDGDGGFYF